ncbi:unnamed protein product, partial [Gulo gulo]
MILCPTSEGLSLLPPLTSATILSPRHVLEWRCHERRSAAPKPKSKPTFPPCCLEEMSPSPLNCPSMAPGIKLSVPSVRLSEPEQITWK